MTTEQQPQEFVTEKASKDVFDKVHSIPEGPSDNTILTGLLAHIILDDFVDEDLKRCATSYLYTSVFRDNNTNRDYTKIFLYNCYFDIARIMGYEHECWGKKLFREVFHMFMSSNRTVKSKRSLLIYLFEQYVDPHKINMNEYVDIKKVIEVLELYNEWYRKKTGNSYYSLSI
jgi:hypothetical protein